MLRSNPSADLVQMVIKTAYTTFYRTACTGWKGCFCFVEKLPVNLSSMSDINSNNYQFIIPYLANNSVATYSVAPKIV